MADRSRWGHPRLDAAPAGRGQGAAGPFDAALERRASRHAGGAGFGWRRALRSPGADGCEAGLHPLSPRRRLGLRHTRHLRPADPPARAGRLARACWCRTTGSRPNTPSRLPSTTRWRPGGASSRWAASPASTARSPSPEIALAPTSPSRSHCRPSPRTNAGPTSACCSMAPSRPISTAPPTGVSPKATASPGPEWRNSSTGMCPREGR